MKNVFEMIYVVLDCLTFILTPTVIVLNVIGIIKNKKNPKKKSKYYNVTTKLTLITQIMHVLYFTFYTINYFSVYVLLGLIILYIANYLFIKKIKEDNPRKKQLTNQLVANIISSIIIVIAMTLDILKMFQ